MTSLHIFVNQKWNWSPIHAPNLSQAAEGTISSESTQFIKEVIFGHKTKSMLNVTPLNGAAQEETIISSLSAGGNLSLVQFSIGTNWEIQPSDRILFLEEVNEHAYRIEERLEHLRQASILHGCSAIVLGNFIAPLEDKTEQNLMPRVLQRFADKMDIPVLSCSDFGHGAINFAFPIGKPCQLKLGSSPSLSCAFS